MKATTPKAIKKSKPKSKMRTKSCTKAALKRQVTPQEPPADTYKTPQNTLKAPSLTPKQQMFVLEYLVDLNATQAALRAGYSAKTAGKAGTKNTQKGPIKEAIDAAMAERAKRVNLSADRVLQELALIGFANMADFIHVDESGMVQALPFETLAEGQSRIVKKVKDKRVIRSTKGTEDNPDGDQILDATFEFELCDKVKSLELLARHLGLLHDKTEVDLKQPVQITIKKFCSRKTAKDTDGSRATS
jgi:phage terminase small subunit